MRSTNVTTRVGYELGPLVGQHRELQRVYNSGEWFVQPLWPINVYAQDTEFYGNGSLVKLWKGWELQDYSAYVPTGWQKYGGRASAGIMINQLSNSYRLTARAAAVGGGWSQAWTTAVNF